MNRFFRIIMITAAALAAATGALYLTARLGGLERQARAQVDQALALPPAYSYAARPGPIPGQAPAEEGWTDTPAAAPGTVITRQDVDALPEPARRYFRRAGVEGKPRISSFSVVLEGRIRNGPDSPWMPLVMRQFNRMDNPARVVFLTSIRPPMNGIDSFLEGKGRMRIKALDLLPVADAKGPDMAASALVTFLNDLVLCPLGYFSLPVRWRQAGPDSVELSMTYSDMTVTAVMTVDAAGNPVDWSSGDRYAEVKGATYRDRWSTPFQGSRESAGLRIPERGKGIHDPGGAPFVYIELDEIGSLVLDAKGLPEAE